MAEIWYMTVLIKQNWIVFLYFPALEEMQRRPLHLLEMFHAIWPWRNRNYLLMTRSSEFNGPTRLPVKRNKRTIGLWVDCFIVFLFFFKFLPGHRNKITVAMRIQGITRVWSRVSNKAEVPWVPRSLFMLGKLSYWKARYWKSQMFQPSERTR